MRQRNSFWAGLTGHRETRVPVDVIEAIRSAMLKELGNTHADEDLRLDMEITFATDLNALWELRVKLRSTLQSRMGAEKAQEVLDGVTELFYGHHPAAQRSKFTGT